jgi:hypothetical protein
VPDWGRGGGGGEAEAGGREATSWSSNFHHRTTHSSS